MLSVDRYYTPVELTKIMGPHFRSVVFLLGQVPEVKGAVDRREDGTVAFSARFVNYFNAMPADQWERIQAIAAMP